MNASVNRQILLVEKPTGKLGPEHFKPDQGAIPEPKDGEVLLRTRYISLDAANRAWMQGATYRAARRGRQVMAGGGSPKWSSRRRRASRPATGLRRHRLAGLCGRAGKASEQAADAWSR